jgi:hypothetical protein
MGSIDNSTLTNSSVSVAGQSVSLGGSTTLGHGQLTNISSNDHHSKTSSASELSDVSADSNLTSADWGDYEIQKNGTDGTGIINFKT